MTPELIYRLHNWCNEDHGDDIIEDAQELMTEAAEALAALSVEVREKQEEIESLRNKG